MLYSYAVCFNSIKILILSTGIIISPRVFFFEAPVGGVRCRLLHRRVVEEIHLGVVMLVEKKN